MRLLPVDSVGRVEMWEVGGEEMMTLDTHEFKKAMKEYIEFTHKNAADALNRQANNLMIQAISQTKQAEATAIRAIKDKPWWPRLVAKIIKAKGSKYTKAQAIKYGNAIIKRRIAAIRFVRFFFVAASQAIVSKAPGMRASTGKRFEGFNANVKPATSRDLACTVEVKYPFKLRGSKTAQQAEALIQQSLNKAMPLVVKDIGEYIERKFREKYSKI